MEHFAANLWASDVLAKLTTCAALGAVEHGDSGRVSPRSYRLSRANGTGHWLSELDGCLASDARFLSPETSPRAWLEEVSRFLKQVSKRPDIEALVEVGRPVFALRSELIGSTESFSRPYPLELLRWCVEIRNKTVGHGVHGPSFWATHVETLEAAVDFLIRGLPLWSLDLRLVVPGSSGGSIARLLQGAEPDGSTASAEDFDDGTPVCSLDGTSWALPPLLWIRDSDNHTFIANGSWSDSRYSAEFVCYAIAAADGISGTVRRVLPAFRTEPSAIELPSETEGTREFDGNAAVPNNLPGSPDGYISRPNLEHSLRSVLSEPAKRHLVNMKGIGGTGKTSLISRIAREFVNDPDCPYQQIIWISARDVDLTLSGPKPVKQATADLKALWRLYGDLWDAEDADDLQAEFESHISDPGMATLLIMDNFETFADQDEAYRYLDDVVQPPSKVVITSRHDFKADYQIPIRGMELDEASQLIRSTARAAQREGIIDDRLIARIHERCEGHPYAMKLLASNVESKSGLEGLLGSVFRDEHLLDALFRRSMAGVDDEAEFIFMLTGRFPKGLSELALRAVSAHEEIDLPRALRVLQERSLIAVDDGGLYLMPAMAREFALRFSSGNVQTIAVEEAERYIKSWSGLAAGRPDVAKLMETAVRRGEAQLYGRRTTDTMRIVAEFHDSAWEPLARSLVVTKADSDEVNDAYKRAVEVTPTASHLLTEWSDVVTDKDRMIQLKVQAVTAEPENFKRASKVARVLNGLRATERGRYSRLTWTSLMEPVANALWDSRDSLDATDFSSLTWLYLNLNQRSQAKLAVKLGLAIDEQNPNIVNLAEKLDVRVPEESAA